MKNRNKHNYIEKMNKLFGVEENENIITKYNHDELVKKYILDIRNLKKLDTEMINNISNMSHKDIIKIINAYNDVTDAFGNFILFFQLK